MKSHIEKVYQIAVTELWIMKGDVKKGSVCLEEKEVEDYIKKHELLKLSDKDLAKKWEKTQRITKKLMVKKD